MHAMLLTSMVGILADAKTFWRSHRACSGQSVGQPRKRECRQNVEKMSENVQKFSGGAENTIFGHFWTIFAYLVAAFVWRPCPMLARYNTEPLQPDMPLQPQPLPNPL